MTRFLTSRASPGRVGHLRGQGDPQLVLLGQEAAGGSTKYPTHFVAFKLKSSNGKRTFSGQISASTSKCVKGRTVEVIRKHNGNQQTVGKDGTDSDGKFSINLSSGQVKTATTSPRRR